MTREGHRFAEALGRIINTTVSPAPIRFVPVTGPVFEGSVSHCSGAKTPEPMPLVNGRFLFVYQRLGLRDHRPAMLEYRYAYQAAADDDESWIFRYEFVGDPDPEYEYARCHLHLNASPADYAGPRPFPGLHLPTGYVTIESVLRHLVVEHELTPASPNWLSVLAESEQRADAAPPWVGR